MEIISFITGVLSSNFKTLFSNLAAEFGAEIEHIINNHILEYQIEEYSRNYATKTLLHRVQPKNLKDFYQPLHIKKCDKRIRPIYNQKRIETNSIKELFKRKQLITLIGNAGSGKSTIVKYLFLNSIDTKFKIPIKVELRYLNDYQGSLIEFVKDKIFKLNKLATHERIIERLMSSGDFVFFLDGYDEINSSKKEKITKEIDDLVRLYSKNFYLLTSRPYTEIDLLPLFHNYEVCQLSDEDINQFIKKQIPIEETELCDKIIQAVNSSENNSYKSFLSNPLLLSMFILTFQSYSSIPQKRSEFYSQVFDALFSVHDSMSKLAFVREKQSGLSKEQIVDVLKLFSFLSYFDEKFIFTSFYLEEKLKFIKEKKKGLIFDNHKLINDLQVAIGILTKEGTDYAFPHRSLQEYFTAVYIAALSNENKKIVYLKIMNALTDVKAFRKVSNDNFHLLLAELDEKGVIEFALIPYFESFAKNTDLDQMTFQNVIDSFLILNSVFESFNYILRSDETINAHLNFDSKFRDYLYSKKEKLKERLEEKLEEKLIKVCRQKLANSDIRPFLKDFLPKLLKKRQELVDYLVNENKTDSEIISLI